MRSSCLTLSIDAAFRPFSRYMQSEGRGLDTLERIVLLRQIAKAVKDMHARDVVHNDLRPDNILLTDAWPGVSLCPAIRSISTDWPLAFRHFKGSW